MAQLLLNRGNRVARRERGQRSSSHVDDVACAADTGADFDSLAIQVNGPRSWDLDIAIDITFADLDANYRLALRNGVLVYRKVAADPGTATVTVKVGSKFRLLTVSMGDFSSPGLEVSGDQTALQSLLGSLDAPDPSFNIVTP